MFICQHLKACSFYFIHHFSSHVGSLKLRTGRLENLIGLLVLLWQLLCVLLKGEAGLNVYK